MTRYELETLTGNPITEEQLEAVAPIYCLLDFDKEDFAKLVTALGIDKWASAARRWDRLESAWNAQKSKERYLQSKTRLADIQKRGRTTCRGGSGIRGGQQPVA